MGVIGIYCAGYEKYLSELDHYVITDSLQIVRYRDSEPDDIIFLIDLYETWEQAHVALAEAIRIRRDKVITRTILRLRSDNPGLISTISGIIGRNQNE